MFVYSILNKPVGYHTSAIESPSIIELLDEAHCVSHYQELSTDIRAVNTLSTHSEGLVLITNDTELTKNNTFTEYEFEITIDEYLSKQAHNILGKGMNIAGKHIHGIKIVEEKHKGKRSVVQLISSMCNDTEIRDMFEAIGYHVSTVRLTRIGKIKLGVLSIGKWKIITPDTIS